MHVARPRTHTCTEAEGVEQLQAGGGAPSATIAAQITTIKHPPRTSPPQAAGKAYPALIQREAKI